MHTAGNLSFSVIMPVFNGERYLREAVGSVIAQTFGDWELLVIDDGSTDRTTALADELAADDSRIRVVHQSNMGPAAARNRGLDLARNRWIAYLDGDDVWFPRTLEHYARHIQGHPHARFLYGWRHRLRGESVTHLPPVHQERSTGPRELFDCMFLTPMSVCHDRQLTAAAGGFDARLRNCEDYDFFLRISLHCPLEPVGLATGLKRRHESNLSCRSGENQMVESEVLRRFAKEYGGQAGLDHRSVCRRLGRLYFRAAREYVRERQFARAARAAELARQYCWTLRGVTIEAWSRLSAAPGDLRRFVRRAT